MDKRKNNLIKEIDNFFFDLDGTLLNSQKEISEKTLLSLKKLKKINKKISIATGRPYYFAKKEINLLDIDYPIISTNGAMIFDPKLNKVVYFNPVKKDATSYIFDLLVKHNITFLIYTTEQMFAYQRENYQATWIQWIQDSINARKEEEKFECTILNKEIIKEFDIKNHNVVKFLIIKTDSLENDINFISKELMKIENIHILSSQKNVIDIMDQNSSKGNGLKFLKENYQLDLNKTIVFGDEVNDLSMFELTKYSVAMGQSEENIKNQATFETKNNNEDGIAFFIKSIL